ncbi:NfeD family protein [Tardibacter chloracetimidivorans]|uniref:NfeD family protein n=1 Tax=Tardibacter chloracetimidivorans TaxID=1921510 RepID=UPI000AE13AB1|nr:nodulation protein NfeD [Tardibacter chloracetimidivorans]
MLHAGSIDRRLKAWLALFTVLVAVIALPSSAAQTGRSVPVLHVDGAIGPATSDYVARSLEAAAEEGAPFIVLRMDTPGGLDNSMREIIREILRSPVPVVTYVSPSGARAASAGTFILYASHVAAMSPGTNVGAATPVQLGGGGGPFSAPEKADPDKEGDSGSASASEAKALNDAIAYIRSLADLRGRNADWAEAAVRSAASLPAQAALEQNVIDLVARDRNDLLAQINGMKVIAGSAETTIDTRGVTLVDVNPNWRTRLLGAITNPNIALILMMIGLYGLLFEFMNPGALYPGTIGAICLLIGLYALSALPVNYAGVALILLGIALMAAEAVSPSFGILGIGGIVAFILGATIMIDTDIPEFRLSWPVLGAVAATSLGLTVLIARLGLSAHRRKLVSGREGMIGALGEVVDWNDGKGHVFVHGERWRAVGAHGLNAATPVRVMSVDGITLGVEPVRQAPSGSYAPPPETEN